MSALARYPVKSCRGIAVEAAEVRPWGLVGDRRWMLVDPAGRVITAREHPRLVLVNVELIPSNGGFSLRLNAAGHQELIVDEPAGGERQLVEIWNDKVPATPAAAEAAAWFTEVLGFAASLVFLDDPTARAVNPLRGKPTDVVNFADGYPLLLTTDESLAALNDLILEGRWSEEAPLPMTRFRPSVVVRGAPAWAEDGWRRLRIGDVTFRVSHGCARCVLTTIDPATAEKGKEPLFTLGRHRNWDGKIWFGQNLIPDVERTGAPPVVRVGDPVEVLA